MILRHFVQVQVLATFGAVGTCSAVLAVRCLLCVQGGG